MNRLDRFLVTAVMIAITQFTVSEIWLIGFYDWQYWAVSLLVGFSTSYAMEN